MVAKLPLLLSAAAHACLISASLALGTGAAGPPPPLPPIAIELQETVEQPALEAPDEPAASEEPLDEAPLAEPTVEPPPDAPLALPDPVEPALPEPVPETTPPADWLNRVLPPSPPAPDALPELPPPPPPSARVIAPVPGVNAPPVYPSGARLRGWQGTVTLRVLVDADGHVARCAVATSSGHAILDEAALRAVRGWHFRNGPGEVLVPVEFVLR